MPLSFAELLEYMDNPRRSPLMDSGEEEGAITVVRTGKDLREEGESSFWDEFISLCSNVNGMSQLFNVSETKIRSWPGRIREILDKLDKHTRDNPKEKPKKEMIPTGDNGAFISNTDPI